MGQRLNLSITRHQKVIANCYYHWSGYTDSAFELTKQAVDYIQKHKKQTKNDLILAVEALLSTGATISKDQKEAFLEETGLSDLVCPDRVDRTDGLIGVTEDYKNTTERWQEQVIYIDLEDEEVDVSDALWTVLPEDADDYDIDFDEVEDADPELVCIPFTDLNKTLDEILELKQWYDVHSQNYKQIVG